jgi:hypothetical protein
MKRRPFSEKVRGGDGVTKRSPMKYQDLLRKAKKNPDIVDYTDLRTFYTQSTDYEPFKFDSETHCILGRAMDTDDFTTALEAINTLLTACYIDIHAHMLAVDVYKNLHDNKLETYHMRFATGLLDSIVRSGDGTSFEAAFVVISAQEEYAVLRVLSLEPIMQSFRESEGSKYDVFECPHPKTGKIIEVYFNIDVPMDWLDGKLGHMDLPDEERLDGISGRRGN